MPTAHPTTGPLNDQARAIVEVCPSWCRKDDTEHLTHMSAAAVAAGTEMFDAEVTVSLVLDRFTMAGPSVMVMRHHTDLSQTAVVHLEIAKAAHWATILDAAGSVQLAAGIRETLALVQS